MQGYYKDLEATEAAIDAEGWLHTGDLGEFTAEGFLKITGHKKNLFKLSTGKYIAPQPIEEQLKRSPFVKQAIIIGAHRKFCTLLIFPDLDYLCPQAEGMCLSVPLEKMLKHSKITALYQSLINDVNQHLPHWSTIKRFRLLHLTLAIEEGASKPLLTIKRDNIDQLFAAEIEAMY
ncbi:MAG: long-chain fatty acid--CoA ligase [Leptolyngbyaceae cyanobacterium CSU_1_4]|nr:long-chain fatty acid--CoA ligase [Leptolyngbyaceae cyanobacterium CSU_1_4]